MNQRGVALPVILLAGLIISVGAFVVIKKPHFFSQTEYVQSRVLAPKVSSPSALPDGRQATIKPTATPTLTPVPKKVLTTPPATPKPVTQSVSGPPGAGFNSMNVATEKGNFQASVLLIDLNGARMVTDTAADNDCGNDCPVLPLKDFVSRNNGFAGVNGSYFCPDSYPDCSGKKNSFDFPVYNSRLSKWINQGNLFWDFRALIYADGSGAHYLQNARDFSGSLNAGLANYPGLLSGGNVQIDDNQSGLSDKQKAKGTKVGIGISNSKSVMIVIAQNVNMQEFAYVFKSLGATGALNLDTGGSTALFYNGSYLAGPGRSLPNAIIFVR